MFCMTKDKTETNLPASIWFLMTVSQSEQKIRNFKTMFTYLHVFPVCSLTASYTFD